MTKGRVKKNTANYPHFVDKRPTPPPYPHRPKLIIFTLRNFLTHIWGPPLPLSTFIEINNIFFFFYLTFSDFFLIVKARYRLNTTKYVIKEPQKHKKVPPSTKKKIEKINKYKLKKILL